MVEDNVDLQKVHFKDILTSWQSPSMIISLYGADRDPYSHCIRNISNKRRNLGLTQP